MGWLGYLIRFAEADTLVGACSGDHLERPESSLVALWWESVPLDTVCRLDYFESLTARSRLMVRRLACHLVALQKEEASPSIQA